MFAACHNQSPLITMLKLSTSCSVFTLLLLSLPALYNFPQRKWNIQNDTKLFHPNFHEKHPLSLWLARTHLHMKITTYIFLVSVNNQQLMNEAEYLMKNYEDRGGCCPRRITPSEVSIILHMIRKPNSIIVLLWLKHANLHRSTDVKFIFDSARLGLSSSANILQIADVALRVVFLLFLPCF